MTNLNFLLAGRSNSGLEQAWEVRSIHTDVLVGDVIWKTNWARYAYQPNGQPLDSTSLREIAKFIEDQMDARQQDRQLR